MKKKSTALPTSRRQDAKKGFLFSDEKSKKMIFLAFWRLSVGRWFCLLGLVFLSGCHPAALIIPSYVQLLGVDTFKNQTSYFGLETMLTQDTIRQFQVDGRVPVGDPDKADLLVQLTIRKYDEEPIFYDPKTNAVLQYQLSLTYDLDAIDEREKKTFLEDIGKVHSVIFYTPQYTGAIAETKDAAVARLLQELSEIIVRRVLEGY